MTSLNIRSSIAKEREREIRKEKENPFYTYIFLNGDV